MRTRSFLAAAAFLAATLAAPAHAQAFWTDWTTLGTNVVSGSMNVAGTTVGVTYEGPYAFAQTACPTDYWTGPATTYLPSRPPGCDIIGLDEGGLKTIRFDRPVENPLLALVSWNLQPGVVFSAPIEIVSQGPGAWGTGTFSITGGNTLVGVGEAHGVIRLAGIFTEFSFTDATENWHGFTVGVEGLGPDGEPPPSVPEPGAALLLAAGLFGLGLRARGRLA